MRKPIVNIPQGKLNINIELALLQDFLPPFPEWRDGNGVKYRCNLSKVCQAIALPNRG